MRLDGTTMRRPAKDSAAVRRDAGIRVRKKLQRPAMARNAASRRRRSPHAEPMTTHRQQAHTTGGYHVAAEKGDEQVDYGDDAHHGPRREADPKMDISDKKQVK